MYQKRHKSTTCLNKSWLLNFYSNSHSLSADTQALNIAIDLGTDQGYVMIEDVQIFRHNYNADVRNRKSAYSTNLPNNRKLSRNSNFILLDQGDRFYGSC